MLLSLNNTSIICSQLSPAPLLLQEANDAQDHNNPHDCTWDGDDIVSNQAVRVAHPVCIKTDFINSYLDKMPSKISNSIWQPPKQS